MRTNVVIDDSLMAAALKLSGVRTKKAAIEEGLKLLVRMKRQTRARRYRGKLKWAGDLDKLRRNR
ncbi:MAG: type II toxin-antitoxin system VapB family antitoxin [Planctomycetes bacterium]|nr:type II toxin-antitoxin system VapB family antitoxin [Planctomycetota bacterium]